MKKRFEKPTDDEIDIIFERFGVDRRINMSDKKDIQDKALVKIVKTESVPITDEIPVVVKVKHVPVVIRIKLADLVSFDTPDGRPSQLFGGVRLNDLAESIKRRGLQKPIIVRPVSDAKYQILSGHNRVEATRLLERDEIDAIVKINLSDDEAMGIYFDTNLNQQSFKDWNHSQKIQAIRYTDKLIKEHSQQGKRSDLANNTTSVSKRQKKKDGNDKKTTRDKMSSRLGTSTATLGRYRSIIKLEESVVTDLVKLLDDKILNLEAVYRISQLKPTEIEILVNWFKNNPVSSTDFKGEESDERFKELSNMSRKSKKDLTEEKMIKVILPVKKK